MIKKILCLALILSLISFPAFGAWDKSKPAGTDLISDIDTLVIANNTALETTLTGAQMWKNLKVVRTNVTTVTVTADLLYLNLATSIPMAATAVNEAIAITTAGAGGLDTGAEADVWYYIWIIAKADGTVDGLLSASATAPTLPAGYTYKALVSAVHNTSGNFVDFVQHGMEYAYTTWLTMASGNVGQAAYTSITTTAFIPSGLSELAKVVLNVGSGAAGFASTDSGGAPASSDANLVYTNDAGVAGYIHIKTADTLYWFSNSASAWVYCQGFVIDKLS
jgi:hypothetical protein